MRYPLYPIEVVLCLVTLFLVFLAHRRHTPGYKELVIIIPWLLVKLAYTLTACKLALEAGGDFPPSAGMALFANIIMVAGLASVSALLGFRIWKHPG